MKCKICGRCLVFDNEDMTWNCPEFEDGGLLNWDEHDHECEEQKEEIMSEITIFGCLETGQNKIPECLCHSCSHPCGYDRNIRSRGGVLEIKTTNGWKKHSIQR